MNDPQHPGLNPPTATPSGAKVSPVRPGGKISPVNAPGVRIGSNSKDEGDATGGIVPYKNPLALTGYYCAVFSLIPILGFPLGLAAFVLGILGFKKYRENPVISGVVHAWIAILGGFVTSILWGGIIALMIYASFIAPH